MIRQSVSGLAKGHALNIGLARDRTQNRFPLLLIARFSAIRLVDARLSTTAGPKKDQERTP
jgi:hypothetical protein